MKVKVGTTDLEVEVGQYREVNKGALKAFFSIVEYPNGRKTTDCRLFEANGRRWFSFPTREFKKPGSEKTEYIPYISYIDKDYGEKFKEAVLEALTHAENSGEANTYQKQANPLQDDASSLWFG